jgi:hypothetical protein
MVHFHKASGALLQACLRRRPAPKIPNVPPTIKSNDEGSGT